MSDRLRITPSDLLLVVDVQNDFCPGGALPVPEGDAVVPVANRLARRFEQVALTQDWHSPEHASFASSHEGRQPFEVIELGYGEQILWPDHCVAGTPGAELHPDLDLVPARVIVRKGAARGIDSYSALYENDRRTPTGLLGWLRERRVERLFLVGLAQDFCVRFSALDARREGFEVAVVEDGVRGIDTHGSVADAWRELAEAGVRRVREAALTF
jgi:nicotinamidase/pyrazinamidase